MAKSLPKETRAVIIGGGIVGCSLTYHLTKQGWRDVVLLERRKLTCGTTWHAAGLVGQLRATANMTRLAQYTAELFATLEQETGQATGFKQNGSISVATTEERFEEWKRGASMARTFGLDVEVISPGEMKERWPLLNVEDVVGGVWLPKDGQTNPIDTTVALAKGARAGGALIFEDTKVTAIHRANGRVTGVTTDRGDIEAEFVVNCGGMWAREVGLMCGVNVPLHACEHFYVLTEEMDGLSPDLPVLRDQDGCAYYKEDAGKLLLGAFEPNAKPWGMDGIPEDFAFDELPEDFDHFMPVLEGAMNRVPALQEVGIRKFFNGPESFTPDDRYMLGEAPELKNFFVAAGFNSVGIQSAGGAGKVLAQWMAEGHPPMDLWDVDIRRMFPFQGNPKYLYDRATEVLGLLYDMHWPYRQCVTSRGLRRSPLHDRLAARGACFGEVAGWERANWFAPEGVEPEYEYSYKRQNWFPYAAEEHKAVREAVALFDQTSFGKFLVQGRDAEAVLQRISANDVAVPAGKVVYTQWLNERGGIEADLTVTRFAEDAYQVVTGAAVAGRDFNWLLRNIPDDAHCIATDVTSGSAVLSVMGPNSRALLSKLSDADLSNEAFPFGTAREIDLGMARVRAARITYVGELGWELYVPSEFAPGVFDAILAEGDAFGLRLAGMHVLDSCRIEKAFRHWGHDITDEDTPLEAGLGFACSFDKNAAFIGRDALLRQKEAGLKKRLVQFALEDSEPLLYHNEPIYRDGEIVGYTTSGNYGHHLGAAIALGYVNHPDGVDADFVNAGRYEIEVACERFPARASLRPLYDPKAERIRS
ncbi:MAG: FAD-dependent oxidoreductase [Rhodospirillales bacterium]|nr:FAD-dependent oxidoreductase [Rhodospirillales bacterium]MDH3969468.1 FAD-dependent oxidoreductase [Rhodospirillales bacterium]